MSTHSIPRATARAESIRSTGFSPHWTWLVRGLALGFVVPFVLTDVLELHRDLFYGLYALAVAALFASWSHATGYDLVGAVRSYSQMDRASAQRIDVRDGLESTLTMLGHKLKGGVTVEREYADLPPIDAYAGTSPASRI